MDLISSCEKQVNKMLQSIITQDNMSSYLTMIARFPQMNYKNILLLMNQAPNATAVCGKGAWVKYQATIKTGSKAIALYGPIVAMTQYEDEEEHEDEELDDSITYGILPVFDISQTDIQDVTAIFPNYTLLPIEDVLKEQYGVMILDDMTGDFVPSIFKSRYLDEEYTLYLKPGLSEPIRQLEVLKCFITQLIMEEELTDYIEEYKNYLLIILNKYFPALVGDEQIRPSDLFQAEDTEKRDFLQNLSKLALRAISLLSGRNLLSFSETAFCNILFESEKLSDGIAAVASAAELPDNETIRQELLTFLDKMYTMTEETYSMIHGLRSQQLLFTFPPANII